MKTVTRSRKIFSSNQFQYGWWTIELVSHNLDLVSLAGFSWHLCQHDYGDITGCKFT